MEMPWLMRQSPSKSLNSYWRSSDAGDDLFRRSRFSVHRHNKVSSMRTTISTSTVVGCWLVALGSMAHAADKQAAQKIEPAKVELGRPVDFKKAVQPILEAKCIACHNEAILEGKLNL